MKWNFGNANKSEVGMQIMYCMTMPIGRLAVIEAKRTCVGRGKRTTAAKLYADILEKQYGRRTGLFS